MYLCCQNTLVVVYVYVYEGGEVLREELEFMLLVTVYGMCKLLGLQSVSQI